jgi:membrane-bound lytic murein transglycosylase
MKKLNMTSLMNKATKNRKSAEARAEEAKKAAQEARAIREAERKAAQEARVAKEAEEKAAREARAAEKKESSTPSTTVSLRDAFHSFVVKGVKMMEQYPDKFWEELVALMGEADKANDQQMVFKIQRYYQNMQRAESLISRVRVLRERQKTIQADIKAKVMPWDQAAREAVVLASDAYGYPEIVKEAKKLLEDINRTK